MQIAQPDDQLLLIDAPPRFKLGKNANARNAYGQAAQEIICCALQLDPIPINGRCAVCFDAKKRDTYFEIKSCFKSGKVVIYDWRAHKEAKAGVPVDYAILLHNAKGITDGSQLLQTFADRGLEIIQLPAAIVHLVAEHQPLCQMKTIQAGGDPRIGYNRVGYRDGYRNVPVKALRQYTKHTRLLEFELHGVSFKVIHSYGIAVTL